MLICKREDVGTNVILYDFSKHGYEDVVLVGDSDDCKVLFKSFQGTPMSDLPEGNSINERVVEWHMKGKFMGLKNFCNALQSKLGSDKIEVAKGIQDSEETEKVDKKVEKSTEPKVDKKVEKSTEPKVDKKSTEPKGMAFDLSSVSDLMEQEEIKEEKKPEPRVEKKVSPVKKTENVSIEGNFLDKAIKQEIKVQEDKVEKEVKVEKKVSEDKVQEEVKVEKKASCHTLADDEVRERLNTLAQSVESFRQCLVNAEKHSNSRQDTLLNTLDIKFDEVAQLLRENHGVVTPQIVPQVSTQDTEKLDDMSVKMDKVLTKLENLENTRNVTVTSMEKEESEKPCERELSTEDLKFKYLTYYQLIDKLQGDVIAKALRRTIQQAVKEHNDTVEKFLDAFFKEV